MRYSKYYIPTLKEAPNDAEVVSHKLLLRAGMIRKLSSGIYSWLPLGLKTLDKAAQIVRREMNKEDALEVLLPAVQPADLWIESERWQYYGKELLRFKDRHEREFCLGPTHEEVITDLIRHEIRSYKQLPVNLYQIQTKFRDEIRPRFGLMRGREFIMKDAYSFDTNNENADVSYSKMRSAYNAIFSNMALNYRMVEADSGSIGGSFSHEFMVLAQTGEDTIASCTAHPACQWASNTERSQIVFKGEQTNETCPYYEEVSTPNAHTIEEICAMMQVEPQQTIKTLILVADEKTVAVLVRGDREMNIIKVKNMLDAKEIRMAFSHEVEECTQAKVGFAGPVELSIPVYADNELMTSTAYVVGANKSDTHYKNVDLKRDCSITKYADLRLITEGDSCPECGAPIRLERGIEVGHIFKLGTKYSEKLNAKYIDENGQENLMIMGCYGIGVSRVVAACIEQNHDDYGISFPPPLAPFDIALLNLDIENEDVNTKAEEIYAYLQQRGYDVLYDERKERAGIKFKDADLIGIPVQIVIGSKNLANNKIEVKNRKTNEKQSLEADTFIENFENYYAEVMDSWK